jgi:hypothetical protein
MDDKNMNQDSSRFEEVPQKGNPVANALKYFGRYLKNVFKDFITSFKYNNMKLSSILVALPGLFLGFFIRFHADTINALVLTRPDGTYVGVPFDYTGPVLFILVLFGILNIFTALSLSNKKNLGSVITSTITTSVIVICGILYLLALFAYNNGVNSGEIQKAGEAEFGASYWISIISVIIAMATSVVGVILAFINYDRTYEKVDR